MLVKKFIYNNIAYRSELEVRKAIFKQERRVIGKTPSENVVQFWEKNNVIFSEEENKVPLDELKARKEFEVKQAFLRWRNNNATMVSSLGFVADSNERAKSDVAALLTMYESRPDELVTFRDADNKFHSLTFTNLKTLMAEIIENGLLAYQQKWQFDALVEKATTEEELGKIVIKFEGKDYSVEE